VLGSGLKFKVKVFGPVLTTSSRFPEANFELKNKKLSSIAAWFISSFSFPYSHFLVILPEKDS